MEIVCTQCGNTLPAIARFCDECGSRLGEKPDGGTAASAAGRERKLVTIMFSDISGYTALSENHDMEKVKSLRDGIFAGISRIVSRYGGVVEKYIGDAVMVLFGLPQAHEDDPVRAIRAAREIHEFVRAFDPGRNAGFSKPQSMHTGINTGFVITGGHGVEGGTLGTTGEAVSLASRLADMANADEIIVGPDTFHQAKGFFSFQRLQTIGEKGDTGAVHIYRVTGVKAQPDCLHRPSGLRAELIGRGKEISILRDSFTNLRQGRGSIVAVSGDAGTGKSRLVEEFRAGAASDDIVWLTGHSYAYSQNIPYAAVIDLLNRFLGIKEDDSTELIKRKIEAGMPPALSDRKDLIAYIGGLYSIAYPEIRNLSPEYRKSELHSALMSLLAAITGEKRVIMCLEDLQWADPSSIELLRSFINDLDMPVLLICVFRQEFRLFEPGRSSATRLPYHEIRLRDLDPADSRKMVESLLGTESIPEVLESLILEKVDGNPFYLEEIIHNLIESDILTRQNGEWTATRPISEISIPSSIQGVIAARLDRLEKNARRVLQEASVIGRNFFCEILRRISEMEGQVNQSLKVLEGMDLIYRSKGSAELEYTFKHVLTQEAAYNGLLKKERQILHERIASVMEQLLHDRIPEFYETLAYHYKSGRSPLKAIDYLIRSGWKSQTLYAVEESDGYYRDAYRMLLERTPRSKEEDRLVADLLVKWAYVFNHRGHYEEMVSLFLSHEETVGNIEDRELQGMFYSWLGWGLKQRERLTEGHDYLLRALRIGEEHKIDIVIGYTCARLSYVLADLGQLDKAVEHALRACGLAKRFYADRDLFAFAFSALGQAYWFRGYGIKAAEAGKSLFDYGQEQSCLRCQAQGHWVMGMGHSATGDLHAAADSYQRFIKVSPDPLLYYTGKFMLGMTYLAMERLPEALQTLNEVIEHHKVHGMEYIGTVAQALQGVTLIATGSMGQGVRMCEDTLRVFRDINSRYRYCMTNHMLGKIFLSIVQRRGPFSFKLLLKNIGFIAANFPIAARKAEHYYREAVTVAREIGAEGILGQACLELGELYRLTRRHDDAVAALTEAVRVLERCEAETLLRQARQNLDSSAVSG